MRLLMNVAWWMRRTFMAGCLWLAGGALALTIPATPLGAGMVVEPNVLYLLDDSGSMMWDIMPDEGVTSGYHGFLFPQPDSVYGSALYYTDVNLNDAYVNKYDWASIHLAIPNFSDENIYNVYLRSSRGNSIFYDPKKTYLPWLDNVGMPYGADALLQNANPKKAYWNPANPGAGNLDLTAWQTSDIAGQPWVHWFYANVTDYSQALDQRVVSTQYAGGYYPMTFYVYDGGNDQLISSYTRYQIRGSNAYRRKLPNGIEEQISNSLVWPGAVRTVEQEKINFANWFQYYRSRILAVKGATSRAFSELSSGYRIGLATINMRGSSDQYEFAVPVSGSFSGSNRKLFFDRLFSMPVYSSGTPLRSALSWAGDQYSKKYWQDAVSCRRAFTILTTDGYWNAEANIEVGNVDGGQPSPFSDSQSNTLADVAMHYWKNDLSTLKNDVRALPDNPQTQQHMTTFGLSLGTQGVLNPLVDLPALTAGSLAWPDPFNSRPAKIDDLWHASINSRGRFIAAGNPDEFRQGLVDALEKIGSSVGTHSAGAVSSTMFSQGSMYFQTQFDANDWSGQLDAYALRKVGQNTVPEAFTTWRAAKLLAGNGNRQIFVGRMSHGSRAVPFRIESLSSVNGGLNAEMVDYLRGSRANEAPAGLSYRERSSLLGDIIGSSPLYVGKPSSNLPASQLRPTMLYVSANDGMVHGFNAQTGQELFAYIPSPALDKLKALVSEDYSAKHQYLVDGLLSSAEVKFTNGWRTYMAGSQGRGGASLFLLDITNPQDINERSLNSLKPVVWEFTRADDENLGLLARAAPHIVKLNDGNNYVLAPNGYNSKLGTASMFILPAIKPLARWQSGRNYWRLTTDGSKDNGLSAITPHDLDGNGTIDVVYAGDLKGNVWKFDLSATVPSQWRVALSGESLFQALGPDGLPQPIISAPVLAKHPGGSDTPASISKTGLMVYVGTGRFLDECDQAGVICTGEASVQSIYGLWDYGGRVCQRAELLQQTLSNAAISDVASGTFRKVSNHALTYPPASIMASACKVGSTPRIDVASPSVRYPFPPFALPQDERALQSRFWLGWYMDLPSEDERVVGDLRVGRNRLEVMTYIPATNTNDVCAKGEDASYVLRVNALNGGTFRRPRFIHPALDKALAQGEPDAPEVVGMLTKGSLGGAVVGRTLIPAWRNGMPGEGITEPNGRTVRRVSWREIMLE